jgi:membrane protease YdiL (CAAX protease family)
MVEPSTALLLITNVVVLGAIASWGVIVARLWRGQPLLDEQPRRPVPWDWIDLLVAIAIFIGANFVCGGIAWRIVGEGTEFKDFVVTPGGQVAMLGAVAAAEIFTLLACVVLLVVGRNATAEDLGFSLRPLPRDIVYGAVGFLASAPLVYGIQIFFVYVVNIQYDHPLLEALKEKKDPATIAIVTFTAVVAAPLVEEFFFRVLLQGWLEKLEVLRKQKPHARIVEEPQESAEPVIEIVGEPSADIAEMPAATTGLGGLPLGSVPILISSVLFALVHLGHGAAPIPLFVFALVLGYLYQKTHRIWPSLVAHYALNALSMAMLFLAPMPAAN